MGTRGFEFRRQRCVRRKGKALSSSAGRTDILFPFFAGRQNVTLALRFIKERGVHLTNIAAEGTSSRGLFSKA